MSVCLLIVTLWSLAGPRQDAPVRPAPERLSGVWSLNKDLSTAPPAGPADGRGGGERGRGGPGGGRSGMGGGRPGGGMGRGGGRSGAEAGQAQARAVFEEFGRAPATWMIARTPEAVSFTDPDGVVRRFAPTGKTEKVAMNGEIVAVKSAWQGDVLTQTAKAGGATIVRAIETTTDGRQLVVTITRKGGVSGDVPPLRFVDQRAELR